ncbi:DUF2723 domain-containing protein [bacterium]|nr:MAG: DUF2723 domain-containing protein [bacterium]
MLSNHKKVNQLLGLFTFLFSFILYVLTLAPTASFWDPGEFIAVANRLQVTHPPGAPFFLLMGRMFSLFASPENVAFWVNMLSAVMSAATIMFLHLIVVRLMIEFKGKPDELGIADKVSIYGSGLIAALTFAVSDTFWFSAVEAEVYASSMFFTSIVVWLTMKWSEHHDEPGNERWLVLIAYMFGLALGVHLLNVLCLFFVALIVYFKKTEFKWTSFIAMGIGSVLAFGSIYPFTVTQLATIAGSIEKSTSYLIGPATFIVLFILLIIGAIYYTHIKGYKIANIVAISYAMIVIGYSSYALVFIRSIANPPVDENDPETMESFISYIKREQYGSTPILSGRTYDNQRGTISKETLFPRRYSQEPRHVQKYAEYSSDWDYFWNYQMNHMYIRYFNWNFIGRESDIQDTGWDAGFSDSRYKDNWGNNNYFFLPFLLGLLGLIFHVQKDWKRALAVSVLFIVTGIAIIVYLNQYPYQPRERDYAYVGSFFAFAIWVGIGFGALLDGLKSLLDKTPSISYGAFALVLIAVPGNMLVQNYDDHDRSLRYVAPDYAYNLLNSVAPYGILFTNGDNDTFPLWYLQEVEKVRTDVRVVCLSLLNTPWYINQLKNQWSHESPPVELTLSDDQIKNIESKFQFSKASDFWEPKTVRFKVDKELLKNTFYTENNEGSALENARKNKDLSFYVKSDRIDFPIPVDSLDDEMSFSYKGNFLTKDGRGNELYYTRVQDDLIMDIIKANVWKRPIYFAITVSRDGQLNMQNYFYLEGQAYRLIPKRHNEGQGKVIPAIHAARLDTFKFREVNNPKAYFDENIRRMMETYRELYANLVSKYLQQGNKTAALEYLKKGESQVPFNENLIYDATSIVRYAYRYAAAGSFEDATRLIDQSLPLTLDDLKYFMDRIGSIESEAYQTEQAIREARQNADMKKAYSLQSKLQALVADRDTIQRELYYAASRIFVAQRVFWMSGLGDRAVELANEANLLTENLIGFPTDEAENKRQVDRIIF